VAPPIKKKRIPEAYEVPENRETAENERAQQLAREEEHIFMAKKHVARHELYQVYLVAPRSHRLVEQPRTAVAVYRALLTWLRPIVRVMIALATERRKNTQEFIPRRNTVTVHFSLSLTFLFCFICSLLFSLSRAER
jgi:hypothetical protein